MFFSTYLILETFENQVSLHIFKLLDLLLLLELVVLHSSADIVRRLLGVEHMGTQVKHCLLVNHTLILLGLLSTEPKSTCLRFLFLLSIEGIFDRVPLHKLRDLVNELTFLDNLIESLFA